MSNGVAVHTDTRQKIIKATILVAAKHGFDRATTGEISRTAGVSEGIIYHYFRSKQELYVSMLRERAAEYRQVLEEEIGNIHGPKRKLARLIDFHFVHFTGKKSVFHGVLDKAGDTPIIKEQLVKIAIAPYAKIVAEIIKEGAKSGEFKEVDAAVAALNLLGMMQVPALVMHFGQADFSVQRAVDTVKQIFFGGLLK